MNIRARGQNVSNHIELKMIERRKKTVQSTDTINKNKKCTHKYKYKEEKQKNKKIIEISVDCETSESFDFQFNFIRACTMYCTQAISSYDIVDRLFDAK